jgi:uncharacterized protein YcaQ
VGPCHIRLAKHNGTVGGSHVSWRLVNAARDPVVWGRDRFELLRGWVYRFEAYTPAPKRKLGYFALPRLRRDLWSDRVTSH